VEIRRVGQGDEDLVVAASHLFDAPVKEASTRRFLDDESHHLLVAYEGNHPVGFVSGVEMIHPDKGTEMFLYELAVEEPSRRRGFGRALVERLGSLAQDRGCYGMWVITDSKNPEALATYTSSGGKAETEQVVVVWTF
jgi:ribosomal protein S18 acetylase RimI-like enzyme